MPVRLSYRFRANLIETQQELLAIPNELRRRTMNAMSKVASDYVKDAIADHTKTGVLASSFFDRQLPSKRGREVGHDLDVAPYAKWLIGGSRPHRIPSIGNTTAKTLYFYWPKVGRYVFRKSVWHPGYKGDDYISRAHDRALSRFDEIMNTIDISDL